MKRAPTIFVLAVVLAACSHYSLVELQRRAIGDLYTVEPQIAWSSTSVGKVEVWTVDGPSLEAVHFVKGLEDGDSLEAIPFIDGPRRRMIGFKAEDDEERPKFRKHMTASEVMEFIVDSMTVAGAGRVNATNLRPGKFGGLQGFRFDLTLLSADGLEQQGLVAGAVADERLNLIIYLGTQEYYYLKYKDHVERLIDSIEM